MNKKRVCVVTSTRAEYGLLKNLICKIEKDEMLELMLAVTGSHLLESLGNTIDEIKEDSININAQIDIQITGDSEVSVCKTMGQALISFSDYFAKVNPDIVILLGDRYEICAIACAALNLRIPIAHIHGGETTEGAVDEAFRHAITKMSYLHFVCTKEYRKRVIQLGESPDRVYNVGALGVENINKTKLMSIDELENSLGFKLGNKYAVGTFHPVTLGGEAERECRNIMEACAESDSVNFLFTKSNADAGGQVINSCIEEYSEKVNNIFLVSSLGYRRYLSALKHASFVIGNSSSGIIEAPSFKIPTINIGIRQKGRIQGNSIINVEPEIEFLKAAIKKALIIDRSNYTNPYFGENTSDRIIEIIKNNLLYGKINLAKSFYDLEV